jgi:RNA polymerase sigma factor (sigma-70 family)
MRSSQRARRRIEHNAGSRETMADLVGPSNSGASDERPLTHVDRTAVLWRAIDRLEERYRSVLVLVDVEQQTYEATAQILGIPISTVRSRLFCARRLVRSVLTPYARNSGVVDKS